MKSIENQKDQSKSRFSLLYRGKSMPWTASAIAKEFYTPNEQISRLLKGGSLASSELPTQGVTRVAMIMKERFFRKLSSKLF